MKEMVEFLAKHGYWLLIVAILAGGLATYTCAPRLPQVHLPVFRRF